MENLMVLGTGNAVVTHCYNTCFAIQDDEEYFLVDAGGGNRILEILDDAHIDQNRIHHLFVTHEHCDHILGVVWLVRSIGGLILKGSYEGALRIYCHAGLVNTIQTLCALTLQKKFCKLFGDRIVFVPLEDGQTERILDYTVTFFDIHSTKARQFGFTTTLKSGRTLTCTGDEPCNEACYDHIRGRDWLLCEAFCLYGQRETFKPYEKHHSTVMDAAKLATELGVKNLVLWHTEDSDLATRKLRYTAEGREFFSGKLFVPDDLEVLPL